MCRERHALRRHCHLRDDPRGVVRRVDRFEHRPRPRIQPFDPYPFSLFTLILSLEAIFLSIWILIGQNHMMRLADRRAHLDLQINLLAEQESTAAIRMLRRISARLGIATEEANEAALAEETDVERIVTDIDQTLPS